MSDASSSRAARRHIVVLGLMGVGKTTTGSALADALGYRFIDSDAELSRVTGRTGADVAELFGVEALHVMERGLVALAMAQREPVVVAAAASVVEEPAVRRLLSHAVVIQVDADLETIHRRQGADDHRRPMSAGELREVADRRRPLFAEVTDLCVDGTTPTDQIVKQITDYAQSLEAAQ